MKNKIAYRLISYFAVSLLIFSLTIGLIFSYMFTTNTIEIHKSELMRRATTISETLSNFMNGENIRGQHMMGGMGAYLKFIDDIAMSDVWIIDKNSLSITSGSSSCDIQYTSLPKDAEELINDALDGKTVSGNSFSSILQNKTITVAVPIYSYDKAILGAVILHSSVDNLTESTKLGNMTLILSMLVAMTIAIITSVILSLSFTRPINKIKHTVLKLINGNYNEMCDVNQRDEIGELAANINILSDRLKSAEREREKLDKVKKNFISNITHELRTPITVIRGSLEAICDGVITDKSSLDEYNNQMLNESIYMQSLINDLLDLSKLQNEDFVIEKSPIYVSDMLSDIFRSMQRIAEKKNTALELDSDIGQCSIYGDYIRIRQMLLIVIDNAIKFSDNSEPVKIIARRDNDFVSISISNHGIGIPEEDLPYIFDRFYKSKDELNKSGTGLGLAIAKQIAIRHDIEISVESKENKLTVFSFRIPLIKNLVD